MARLEGRVAVITGTGPGDRPGHSRSVRRGGRRRGDQRRRRRARRGDRWWRPWWETAGRPTTPRQRAGIASLTRTLARELGPSRINVNAVAPGFIETRLAQAQQEGEDIGIPEQVRQMALMLIALQRNGQPKDVANAHLYLVSEEADHVSGVILPVAGGQLRA